MTSFNFYIHFEVVNGFRPHFKTTQNTRYSRNLPSYASRNSVAESKIELNELITSGLLLCVPEGKGA